MSVADKLNHTPSRITARELLVEVAGKDHLLHSVVGRASRSADGPYRVSLFVWNALLRARQPRECVGVAKHAGGEEAQERWWTMTRERTLLIIKPDVASSVEHVCAILIRIFAVGFSPIALQRLTMTTAQVERLYEAHVGQPYHARNVEFMTSGPSVQVVLEGTDACKFLRDMIGPTDPQEAKKYLWRHTLRAIYGTDLPRNAVHGSANARDAEREIGIFFPKPDKGERGYCSNCGGDGLWCCYKSEQFQRAMKGTEEGESE